VKSLVVVPPVAGALDSSPERRKHQRRMGLPRRLSERRNAADAASLERRVAMERRGIATRRRRPDRRIGLSPDLDLYLLGI